LRGARLRGRLLLNNVTRWRWNTEPKSRRMRNSWRRVCSAQSKRRLRCFCSIVESGRILMILLGSHILKLDIYLTFSRSVPCCFTLTLLTALPNTTPDAPYYLPHHLHLPSLPRPLVSLDPPQRQAISREAHPRRRQFPLWFHHRV